MKRRPEQLKFDLVAASICLAVSASIVLAQLAR
jgi:hypothetical protein